MNNEAVYSGFPLPSMGRGIESEGWLLLLPAHFHFRREQCVDAPDGLLTHIKNFCSCPPLI